MKTLFSAGILSLCLCLTSRADLKWEQTTLELHPEAGAKEAVGHFKYQNTGTTPVRFKSVKTSCGCTVAQTQKEEVPPGDKGEITATFKIGEHTGTQIKQVTVETDEGPRAVTILTLKTILPQMLTLNPPFVYWQSGDDGKPKMITVTADKDFPATSLTVTSSNPEFLAKVEPGDTKGTWKINVEPKQTTHAMAAQLTIRPDYPKDSSKLFYANASVTGAPVLPPQTSPLPQPQAKK